MHRCTNIVCPFILFVKGFRRLYVRLMTDNRRTIIEKCFPQFEMLFPCALGCNCRLLCYVRLVCAWGDYEGSFVLYSGLVQFPSRLMAKKHRTIIIFSSTLRYWRSHKHKCPIIIHCFILVFDAYGEYEGSLFPAGLLIFPSRLMTKNHRAIIEEGFWSVDWDMVPIIISVRWPFSVLMHSVFIVRGWRRCFYFYSPVLCCFENEKYTSTVSSRNWKSVFACLLWSRGLTTDR